MGAGSSRAVIRRSAAGRDHPGGCGEQFPHCDRGPPVPRRSPRRPAPRAVRTRCPPHWTPQGRTPRPQRRHRRHSPLAPAHPYRRPHAPAHQDPASERRIALPTECLYSLKEHKERQDKERKTVGPDWKDSGLVFTTPTGRPLDPANLARRFRSFLHRADLRRIRFHDLRHSTATLLLEQGVDLVVIKELLGHAHIGVTAGVYAHVRLRLQRQAIDTLNKALNGTAEPPDNPPAAALVR